MKNKRLPEYKAPQVITYTDSEILEELGPAQALRYLRPMPQPRPRPRPANPFR
jgi:hypothetical protein